MTQFRRDAASGMPTGGAWQGPQCRRGPMTQRKRKLAGTVLMLALIVVWSILATAVYANWLGGQPWWVLIPYFAIAGLGWGFPAGALIRWMAKPD